MNPLAGFLALHGIAGVIPEDLAAALADALAQQRALLYPPGDSAMTRAEADVLREGGFDPVPRDLGASHPVLRFAAEHAAIVQTGWTVAEAAKHLGVTEGRIRQRLAKRELFGVESRGQWRLPAFQFTDAGELPGWSKVLGALPPDLSAVEMQAWLALAHPDLVVGGGPVSPRDWLLAGRAPESVADIAAGMG